MQLKINRIYVGKENDLMSKSYEDTLNLVQDMNDYDLSNIISSLEKQVAKKITHPGCYDNEGVWHTWNGINGVPYDLCPSCETNLCTDGAFGRDKKRMKYCENCGQKLDWT